MGVVRREGNWRLEKQDEGLYEITYQQEPQTKVLTDEYTPDMMENPRLDAIPVREVGSYSEVKQIFEEMAEGNPSAGVGSFGGVNQNSLETEISDTFDSATESNLDGEDVNLPPGLFAVVLILSGGVTLGITVPEMGSILFIASLGFILGGLVIFSWAGLLYKQNGWSEAMEFLFSTDENESKNDADETPEKTPPTPEKLKNKLIFDRAGQQCEWCNESFDHPHVHHIQPRREGGPNKPSNLIVLCPNCHEKADREAIPRSKLKAKVKRQPEIDYD